MFFCNLIVCLCGFGFVVEGADEFGLAVKAYLDLPFFSFFLEAHPLVFRGWILCEMYAVVGVLPVIGRPEVRIAIIEAVMVDVIDEKMIGRVENLAVHLDMFPLFITDMNPADGIIRVFGLVGVPFVFAQPLEIFRVDDGVLSLCQRYPAESVAVARPAV